MPEFSSVSWNKVVEQLKRAAADVRDALEQSGSHEFTDNAAGTRLKSDVLQLEQSASQLRSKLLTLIEEQRKEIETSFDRERAEHNANQLKASLEELGTHAARLASAVAAAAGTSIKQAEPELRTAAGALEDVAISAVVWMRSLVDPAHERPGKNSSQERAPLDDL